MAKYIDVDKLKKFIESIGLTPQKSADYNDGRDDVKRMVLDFIDSLQQEQPSFPSNLDEAANKFAVLYDQGTCDGIAQECFKAGAEWMAEQGVSADSKVTTLAKRAWVTVINEKQLMQDVYDNFVSGDKVIVQIRKKQ